MKRFLLTDAAVRGIDGIWVYLVEQGRTRLVQHVMIPMRQTMAQLGLCPIGTKIAFDTFGFGMILGRNVKHAPRVD